MEIKQKQNKNTLKLYKLILHFLSHLFNVTIQYKGFFFSPSRFGGNLNIHKEEILHYRNEKKNTAMIYKQELRKTEEEEK